MRSETPRITRTTVALAAVLAMVATIAGIVSAGPAPAQTAGPSECPAPAATATKLRVTVQSSAEDVKLHLQPGTVTGRRDIASSGGARLGGYVADGLQVLVPKGQSGSFTTQLISVDPTRAGKITLLMEKSSGGKATVTVSSGQPGVAPVQLAASGKTTRAQVTVTRSRLYDADWSLPKADDRKLVLAAYYPWFSREGYTNPQLAEQPEDPRSVWDPAGVLSMTQQARSAGVDGFVVSWMGEEKNGAAYDVAMRAAEQTGGYVAPYLEVAEALNKAGLWGVRMWLAEAIDASGPASLTIDGVPVVFVWDMAKISPSDWRAVLDSVGTPVHLIGDADTNTYGPVMQGWHQYLPKPDLTGEAARATMQSAWMRSTPALNGTTPKLNIATVSPGFDDRNLRGADREVVSRDGNRYMKTWDAALAADPDMILVTSWNEWFEGSEIEPGTRWGKAALWITAYRSSLWKSGRHACPTP